MLPVCNLIIMMHASCTYGAAVHTMYFTPCASGFRVMGPHERDGTHAAGHRFEASAVVVDPYARDIISRRRYGELGPALDYVNPGVLGVMNTWPQAASSVPSFKV